MKRLTPVITSIIVIIFLSADILIFAADTTPEAEKSISRSKGVFNLRGPIQKAGRGLNNTVLGWTEIPKRIIDVTKESNPVKGLLLGMFQGTCKAFARTASGLSELATFPVGRYDKPAVLPDMPAAK